MARSEKKRTGRMERTGQTKKIKIREAAESDLPAWQSLAGELFQNSLIELDEDDLILLAYASRQPIGFVHLHPVRSSVLLSGIGVIQAWRGMGIGGELMRAAMEKAGEKWPGKPLQLEVEQTNPAALRLYASWGFMLTQTGPTTYQLRRAVSN